VSESGKLTVSHLRRQAFVYLRQSSQAQVERNVESTDRQYALVGRAMELGFAREQVVVIDEDLGISGSGLSDRSGFARLAAEVALGHAGLVLGLEVSRLARNNVDWYRLLDLCGVTDTVIGDTDGLYHPGSFNDRLLLGLKGTMSEAELHVLRARLEGGIRNKAARGELRTALPVGFVWGDEEGEVLIEPDEAIRGAIQTIFDRFQELGSVRQVAVDAPRGRAVPDAPLHPRRDRMDCPDLSPDPQRAREPGLCRRIRVRQDQAGTLCR
jgi:DNA invertase Pin-like site-specific DNA recombinase